MIISKQALMKIKTRKVKGYLTSINMLSATQYTAETKGENNSTVYQHFSSAFI